MFFDGRIVDYKRHREAAWRSGIEPEVLQEPDWRIATIRGAREKKALSARRGGDL